jgi:phage terminase Nu1 subunit (DNA packaging protein)
LTKKDKPKPSLSGITKKAKLFAAQSILKEIQKDGRRPTPAELKIIREAEEEQALDQESIHSGGMILSTQQVADFFSVTSKTVAAWAKQGMPKVGYGKWNLKRVFDWWKSNIALPPDRHDERMLDFRRTLESEKVREKQIKNEMLLGNLMKKGDVKAWLSGEFAIILGMLEAIPDRISVQLDGMPWQAIHEAISKEIMSIKKRMHARD